MCTYPPPLLHTGEHTYTTKNNKSNLYLKKKTEVLVMPATSLLYKTINRTALFWASSLVCPCKGTQTLDSFASWCLSMLAALLIRITTRECPQAKTNVLKARTSQNFTLTEGLTLQFLCPRRFMELTGEEKAITSLGLKITKIETEIAWFLQTS